ncbi:MAG: bis(5'-nucleosyl)-tetraphosphatase (symmetrical) YqeK [Cyanobacteria bacterium P01_F01_bin.150]
MTNTSSCLTHSSRDAILDWLNDHVPKSRLQHILRVEKFSAKLAQHHGVDPDYAAQAGLMHDLAKYFKPKKLLKMAKKEGLVIDPILEANPHLLHADVSAIVARDTFGVTDCGMLEAIANHTLGQPGMNQLSCIVFLADSLEPGRGDTDILQTLRQVSQENLQQAVYMNCDYTLQYLIKTQRAIHPRVIETRNWFLKSTKTATTPST